MDGPREKRRKQAHPQRKTVLQYDVTLEARPDSQDDDDNPNAVGGATGVHSPRGAPTQRPETRTRPGECLSLELLEAGLAENPGVDSGPGPGLDQVLLRGSLEEFLQKTHTTVIYPQSPEELTDLAEDSFGLLLCPFCEQGFRRLSALKEHLTFSHNIFAEDPLMSQVQSQSLHRTSPHQTLVIADVTGNRKLNTDVTGNRKFKCSECGKAFKYKHHLKEHLRIHSGEKPYECSNCKKRFSHSGSYSSHISSRKCTTNNNNSANPANNAFNNHTKNPGQTHQTRPNPLHLTDHKFLSSQSGFESFYSNGQKEIFSNGRKKLSAADDEVSKLRAHLKELGTKMEEANWNIIEFQLEKPLIEEIRADSEPNSAPFLCQFCKESFPSPIPLHQHERYLCKLSDAVKGVLKATGHRKSLTSVSKEQRDCEHFREHFSLTKTNFPMNNEPNPEEILRISLAVGLPQEIIREWFLQQQNETKKHKKSEFPSVNALFATDSNGASINRKPCPYFVNESSSGEKGFETMDLNSNEDVLKQNPSLFGPKSRSNPVSVDLNGTTLSPLNLSSSSKNSFTSEEPHLDFPLDLSLPKVHRPGPGFGYGLGLHGLELEGTTGFLDPFSGPGPGFIGSLSGVGAYHKMDAVFLSNLGLGAFGELPQRRKNQRQAGPQGNGVDGSTDLQDDQSEESLRQKESGSYNCDLCHKTFQKTSSLLRHRYEHTGKRPHQCSVCQKAFKHKHHLLEHSRLHSGEKPYVCDRCGKRFSHSGSYSQHMNHRYAYCRRDQDQSQKDQDQRELKEQKDERDQSRDQKEQRDYDQREQSRDKDQEQNRRSSEGDLYLFKEKPTEMDKVKKEEEETRKEYEGHGPGLNQDENLEQWV